jgi:hypothetical protein
MSFVSISLDAGGEHCCFHFTRRRGMQGPRNIKILFIAGFGPIVREEAKSRKLYGEALGIPFKEETDGYLHTEALRAQKVLPCGRFLRRRSPVLAKIPGNPEVLLPDGFDPHWMVARITEEVIFRLPTTR